MRPGPEVTRVLCTARHRAPAPSAGRSASRRAAPGFTARESDAASCSQSPVSSGRVTVCASVRSSPAEIGSPPSRGKYHSSRLRSAGTSIFATNRTASRLGAREAVATSTAWDSPSSSTATYCGDSDGATAGIGVSTIGRSSTTNRATTASAVAVRHHVRPLPQGHDGQGLRGARADSRIDLQPDARRWSDRVRRFRQRMQAPAPILDRSAKVLALLAQPHEAPPRGAVQHAEHVLASESIDAHRVVVSHGSRQRLRLASPRRIPRLDGAHRGCGESGKLLMGVSLEVRIEQAVPLAWLQGVQATLQRAELRACRRRLQRGDGGGFFQWDGVTTRLSAQMIDRGVVDDAREPGHRRAAGRIVGRRLSPDLDEALLQHVLRGIGVFQHP